jgi:pimeloyl-ACP methyl ester carboxylesterase
MPYAVTPAGKIHYEVIDQVAPWTRTSETIIFHHGIGASPGIWQDWLPHLIDRYRIVRFDMRGYGRSHIPAGGHKWTSGVFVDDLLAVADAAGAARAHVVGESIGGTIALYFALRYPERVATLTISNGADRGAPLQKVNEWQAQLDRHGVKAWSDQFMRDRFYDGALSAEKYAWYAAQQEAWTPDSILGALSVLVGTDVRAELPTLDLPVLLLHGDSSPFIPVNVMVDMHHAIPGSRLQVFPRARHGLPFSHARECARALRQFLDGSAPLR